MNNGKAIYDVGRFFLIIKNTIERCCSVVFGKERKKRSSSNRTPSYILYEIELSFFH